MDISANLAREVIRARLPQNGTDSINELGGSVKCIDFAGKWFFLEWFHGAQVTTLSNIETARRVWIGPSETTTVTL